VTLSVLTDNGIVDSELIDLFEAMKVWGANRDDKESINYEQQVQQIRKFHNQLFRVRFYFVRHL
jgi:hypothetical protein